MRRNLRDLFARNANRPQLRDCISSGKSAEKKRYEAENLYYIRVISHNFGASL